MNNTKSGIFSSIYLVAESIASKAAGLISTIILARILTPSDFGLVAIAVIIIGFFEVLCSTGYEQYLLRAKNINNVDVNTAWTINLVIRFSIFILVCLLSPIFSEIYQDDRLIDILLALSGFFLLGAFENPGIIYLKRNQQYGDILKVTLVAKLVSVLLAISLAFYFKTYWALIAGHAVTSVVCIVGYYVIFPYKPKFTLLSARKQWLFSGWMLPQSILGFFRTQLDTFIAAGVFNKSELGSYQTMKYIAYIPTSHFFLPMTEPLLVELRKVKRSKKKYEVISNSSLIATLFMAVPIPFILNINHTQVVALLLGDAWLEYSALLATFSWLIPLAVIHSHCSRVLIVFNRPKAIFLYEIASFGCIYGYLIFIEISDLLVFSNVRILLELGFCISFLAFTQSRYGRFLSSVRLLLSLCIVLSINYVAMKAIQAFDFNSQYLITELVANILLYLLFYVISIFFLYKLFLYKFIEWSYLSRSCKLFFRKNRKGTLL